MSFTAFDHTHPCSTPAPRFGDVWKHRVTAGGVIKQERGVLIGWVLYNRSFAERSILFYDQSKPAGFGDAIDWPLVIGPGKTVCAEFSMQIPFFVGISYVQSQDSHRFTPSENSISGLMVFS